MLKPLSLMEGGFFVFFIDDNYSLKEINSINKENTYPIMDF